jgi:hypothetical protein
MLIANSTGAAAARRAGMRGAMGAAAVEGLMAPTLATVTESLRIRNV